ncbi:hypothetical protein NAEGRDRAFT_80459 [Naegleria gruberi]|uniref:F-box domain-containing protein n=1 Tax=Naegleria gruberi TaxID=5762 RepID=D2VLK6_NAEGR|nr:uncharacterized protein NAEGRDRAFT_80459 [Naegleria gruberi]EFC42326.1 hypothetical protein NAEGRDRAFT_80459 [Naegleria gruberi]|eukprot:XP_002675070.1 hypothetical protein NAEGRDRAFT_80459 [Naegleria gruberi strain NEG-M]
MINNHSSPIASQSHHHNNTSSFEQQNSATTPVHYQSNCNNIHSEALSSSPNSCSSTTTNRKKSIGSTSTEQVFATNIITTPTRQQAIIIATNFNEDDSSYTRSESSDNIVVDVDNIIVDTLDPRQPVDDDNLLATTIHELPTSLRIPSSHQISNLQNQNMYTIPPTTNSTDFATTIIVNNSSPNHQPNETTNHIIELDRLPNPPKRAHPTHPSIYRQTNENFLLTIYSELIYWGKAIAVGHRDNPHSNNEHFIRSIPYLSEYPHHDTIPKQYPRSSTNFHLLLADMLHIILGFLDCASILRFSRCTTYYYHISHANALWDEYIYLECYIKFSKITLPERFANLYNTKPERRRELLQNIDTDENADLDFRQKRLLNAIDKFLTFYQPSKEESLYNKYSELKNEYQQKLVIPHSREIVAIENSDHEITIREVEEEMDEEEAEANQSADESINIETDYDEDINHFFETLNSVFRRDEHSQNLQSIRTTISREDSSKSNNSSNRRNSFMVDESSNIPVPIIINRASTDMPSTPVQIGSNATAFKTDLVIPNKHFSITSEQLENVKICPPEEEQPQVSWFVRCKETISQYYKNFSAEATTKRKAASSHVRHARSAVDRYYSSYCIFRQEKIRNPFIRSRLMKLYINQIKRRYRPITRWINHVKMSSWLLLTIFAVLLFLKLDEYINWPWFVVFAPVLGSSCLSILISLLVWTPTIGWPIVLYRWVSGDAVGFWTAYAYCLTPRGRIVQLIVAILLALTPCCTFFISLFPDVPQYLPCIIVAAACLIWMYTCTQIIYKTGKRVYPYLLFLVWLGMGMFCGAIILKFAIPFFTANVKWYLICSPLYIVVILIIIYQIKLSIDLSAASSKTCVGLIWSMTFFGFMSVIVLTMVLLILRIDEIVKWQYTLIFTPGFLIFLIGLMYYSVRAFTSKLSPTILKNPFSLFTNGMKNNADMDTYIL